MSSEESKKSLIAEIAFDVQTGLGPYDVVEFDWLRSVGMSTVLAVHLRGLGELEYELLRKVSHFYFDIPSIALKETLKILEEVGFIELITQRKSIKKVIPRVPQFSNIYADMTQFAEQETFNEFEQTTLAILCQLQNKPENKDKLLNQIGATSGVFDRCVQIAELGGLVSTHRSHGRSILVSPVYFGEGAERLSEIAASIGASEIEAVIEFIRANQGWPMSLLKTPAGADESRLSPPQIQMLDLLTQEGVLKPPTIKFANKEEHFVFSPTPGTGRITPSNREIYERAMALVSAVRKGQLLPEQYRIKWPTAILEALKTRGYLNANSEARLQYQNLITMRVGSLREVRDNRWEFHIHKTEENKRAIELALSLVQSGGSSTMQINEEARLALTKDEKYINSIISRNEIKKRSSGNVDQEAKEQFDQMLLNLSGDS